MPSNPITDPGLFPPASDVGTANLVFDGTARLTPQIDTPWNVNSVTFSATAGAFVISGSRLFVEASGITNNSTAVQTIAAPLRLGIVSTAVSFTTVAGGTLVISGAFDWYGVDLSVNGAGNTVFAGTGSDNGPTARLTKNGSGTLTITGSNAYTGNGYGTLINGGIINIQNANALGNPGGALGTTVTAGAELQIQGGITIGQPLTLTGGGVSSAGAFHSVSGSNNWTGSVTLGGASSIGADSGSILTLSNVVSGAAALTKVGNGTLVLSGANTYSGITTVSDGVLNIQNDSALGTIASGTTVNSGATLEMQGGITVTDEWLMIGGAGVSSLGALKNVSGSNTFGGSITLSSAASISSDSGTLTIEPAIGDAITGSFALSLGGAGNLVVNKPITIGGGTLAKVGAGKVTLAAINSYTGATAVSAGELTVNGSISSSAVSIGVSGTLSGTGSVGSLDLAGGTLSPGNGPGILAAGNTIFGGGSFSLDLAGVTLGSQYDQLNVSGLLAFSANTALAVNLGGFDPLDDGSQTFVIVNNDLGDAISGSGFFTVGGTPLHEGDSFLSGSQLFSISYMGGTGNDVVLTGIPEPRSLVMLLGIMVPLAAFHRRRNPVPRLG